MRVSAVGWSPDLPMNQLGSARPKSIELKNGGPNLP